VLLEDDFPAVGVVLEGGRELEVHHRRDDLVEPYDGNHGQQVAGPEREPGPLQGGIAGPARWRRCRRALVCGRVAPDDPTCEEGEDAHRQRDADTHDEPGSVVQSMNEKAERTRTEDSAGDAAQHDQAVDASGGSGSEAVVQESEESGHHQRTVQISEEVE
jgi:hypothetical protein